MYTVSLQLQVKCIIVYIVAGVVIDLNNKSAGWKFFGLFVQVGFIRGSNFLNFSSGVNGLNTF